MARPIGEGGASWISKAAGENSTARPAGAVPGGRLASACHAARHAAVYLLKESRAVIEVLRLSCSVKRSHTIGSNGHSWCVLMNRRRMKAALKPRQAGVIAVPLDQFIVASFFEDLPVLDGKDHIGRANGAQSVRDDEHGTAATDVRQVAL